MRNAKLTSSVKTKPESIVTPSESAPKPKPGRDLIACGALLTICYFLYFAGLGNFPFIDPSESYYVEACREMLQLGDYITPHLNYQIYFSKPIINFWLIAASYKMFGLSEFSARLPFAVLSSALVLATYGFTRSLFNLRAGFISAFCVATSPLLLLVSRKSSIDIGFTFFLNLAVLAAAYTLAQRNKWSWSLIYIALGLGVLTKGPATLVLFCAGMAAFLVVARPSLSNLKDWIVRLKLHFGLPIFLAVVLPWHLAVSSATDGLFLKVFFWYENLARFQGHTNFGTVRHWFYLSVLGYGFFPWIALIPPAVGYALLGENKEHISDSDTTPFHKFFKGTINLLYTIRSRAAEDDQGRALILLTAWSLTTFAFFSVSKTQLATYILPIIAPLSILIGVLANRWLTLGYERLSRGSAIWTNIFSWLFAIAGFASVPAVIYFVLKCSDAPPAVLGFSVTAALVFAIGGWAQLEALRSRRLVLSTQWVAATMALAMGLGTPICFEYTVDKMQGNLKAIAIDAGKIDDKIAMYGNFMPSAMFYSKKPVDTFFHGHQLIPVRTPEPGQEGVYPNVPQAIIVRDSELAALQTSAPCPLELVEKKGNWGLYRTPGYEVDSVKTLEDTFRDPVAFNIIVSGESPTGPLTVPYAAGKLYQPFSNNREE